MNEPPPLTESSNSHLGIGINASIRVLDSRSQFEAARERLQARRLDVSSRFWAPTIFAARNRRPLRIDVRKSWDVEWFAEVLTKCVDRDDMVVDVGGVMSELPWVLHLSGFRNLHGCDIDPRVRRMPFSRHISYHVGSLDRIPIRDGSLGAITAVSTIEHGVDTDEFLGLTARLLRPGGLLCVSTDYWPTGGDVSNTTIFGLPWRIFDHNGVQAFLARARELGLEPLHGDSDIPVAGNACISFDGHDYTFIGAVLHKLDHGFTR